MINKIVGKLRQVLSSTTHKEAINFALICHQRSGSNMLSSILNQHPKVDVFGQLFKDDENFQKKINAISPIPFKGNLFDDVIESRERFDELEISPELREERNTDEFLDVFYKNYCQKTAFTRLGIKFHGGTLYQDELERNFFNATRKIIILHRENLLAAAISWYQARELNQWMRRSNEKVEKQSISMDIDTLSWFIEKTKSDVALWKSLAKKDQKDILELTYEEITQSSFDLKRVWNYLEVSPLNQKKPQTKKLIKDYSHIPNLEEIKNTLENDENGYL
ncbi:hypothetical protein GCM10009117_03960 [Gangjinia marincola]|uniref:Sulphotransferase Stf0 domain-containing protein n=1 Tax=Gangjinia marincola TaxID=578463 RepID=A0ABN1MET9_9FLAO